MSSALRGSAGLGGGRYRTEWGPRLKALFANLSDHVVFYNTIRDKFCEQFTFSSVMHFAFYTPLYSTENKARMSALIIFIQYSSSHSKKARKINK